MLELLRRAVLLIGLGIFLWLWFLTPAALLEVKRADLAAEFQERWGDRVSHPLTPEQNAEALISDDDIPHSAAEFAAMTTKGKLLTPAAAWDSLYRSLSAGPVFYDPDQPPFSQVRADIAAIRSRTQQVASYIPVTQGRNTEYLEILYQDRAKDSHAPQNLTYPRRRTAWPYLVLALFCYILIPRRNASDYSTYSRVVVAALDGIGAVIAGLFFALPLRISPSTDAVLGSQSGMTWFLWCLGVPGVFLVLWAARMAAFRISAGPAGLVVQTLWRGREMLFRDASAAGRLMRGGIAIGVYVRSNAGEVVKLSWAGLMRFQIVLDALYRAGLPMGEDLKV